MLAPRSLGRRYLHPSTILALLPRTQAWIREMSLEADVKKTDPQPRPPSEIPGPKRWPFLQSLPALRNREDWKAGAYYLTWESLAKEYGPIFRLDLPGQRSRVFIWDPKDIESLMKATSEMPKKPMFDLISTVRNQSPNLVREQTGLLAGQGEEWWRLRRMTQVPTMKVKMVAHYLPQVDVVARDFLHIMSELRDHNNQMPDDFLNEIFKWALETLGLVTFSRRMRCMEGSPEGRKIIAVVGNLLQGLFDSQFEPYMLKRWFQTPAYKKFRSAHDQLEIIVMEAIEDAMKRLATSDSENLSLLENLLLVPGMSRQDILVFMLDLILAGIENTSSTVAFTMLSLARNPEKQAKMQEELDQVLGDGRQPLTAAQLGKLSYTKACVRETLRIFPVPIGLPRLLERDVVLGGYIVPKGFEVFVLLKMSGFHEDYFHRASEFLPERWLRGKGDKIGTYASLPFGIGTRMCIGKRLAEQEIHTLLARMFHKYNVGWTHGEVGTKVNFTLLPNNPLNFTITERR